MSLTNLPSPVAAFFLAIKAGDASALLSTFTDDAVLAAMGQEHRGDAIREWNDRLFLGANVSVQPINAEQRADQTVLSVIVDGDYAVFGVTQPVQLDWWFTVTDRRISRLQVVQEKDPDVPAVVLAYIKAANSFDLDAFMACFASDALVNDQRREYVGAAAVRAWAAREIIGDRVTMYVTRAVTRGDNVVVTVNVNGDYDKTGLPDPLALTSYISVRDGRIVQLIILHNKPVMAAA